MKNRYIYIFILLVACVMVGFLLYFAYKHVYERYINKGLKEKKPQNKILSPNSVVKIYLVICIITIFIVVVNIPKDENLSCKLYEGRILLGETDESKVKEVLYDNLSEDDAYTFQRKKVNSKISILYAKNSTYFGYVLEFNLGREPLVGEVITMNSDVASYTIEADRLNNGVVYIIATAKLKTDCDTNKVEFEIYNFSKGKNTDKFHYTESFTIVNGGIEL